MQVETVRQEAIASLPLRIVLTGQENIAGIVRNPGYILLEGICPENITNVDIDRAIQLGQVKVVTVKSKKEDKAEGFG